MTMRWLMDRTLTHPNNSQPLGIQSPKLRMVSWNLNTLRFVLVIIHPKDHLRRWVRILREHVPWKKDHFNSMIVLQSWFFRAFQDLWWPMLVFGATTHLNIWFVKENNHVQPEKATNCSHFHTCLDNHRKQWSPSVSWHKFRSYNLSRSLYEWHLARILTKKRNPIGPTSNKKEIHQSL